MAEPFGPDQAPDLQQMEGWLPQTVPDPDPEPDPTDVLGLLNLLVQKVNAMQLTANRIAGLVGQNAVSRDFVYDPSGAILSFIIRTYDTGENAGADDGETGLLGTYSVTNTLSLDGLVEATATTLED